MSDKRNLEHALGVVRFLSDVLEQTPVRGVEGARLLIESKDWLAEFAKATEAQLKGLSLAPTKEVEEAA